MVNERKIISYILTFIVVFLYALVFFKNFIAAFALAALIAILFYKIIEALFEHKSLFYRRLMFKEFLDIFYSNVLSGMNAFHALERAKIDLEAMFLKDSEIVVALDAVLLDLDNGKTLDESIRNLNYFLDIDECDLFSSVITMALVSGADLAQVASSSKTFLIDGLNIEYEIATISANSKKEFIIMSLLPLLVLMMLSITNQSQLTFIDYLVRSVVFLITISAIYWGYTIVDKEEVF